MTSTSKGFRTDINGLRAWAVVSVVLYHFGVSGFSGGFVGVDVFFVISGFLMTGIIFSSLEKQSAGSKVFSVFDFYLSRARRIIPALLVLCGVLLVVGWLCLPATEYRILGRHALSALSFLSNLVFWSEDGYFDSASHDKLLLHTWSLSVEWQFYLLLPLAMLAVWKLKPGRGPQVLMIATGLLLSLLLCVYITPIKTSAAFYLLPTRAWEMLAGGLLYLTANQMRLSALWQRLIEALGFALLIGSILLFDASSLWPGWRALVPVTGTLLVLLAARQGSLWTASRFTQWLGDCSYSLYLWHWPLVVSLVYIQRQQSSLAIALGLVLTLVLGALSYRFIETPARRSLNRLPKGLTTLAIAASLLVVMVPSLVVLLQHGVPGRLPGQIDAVFAEAENQNPRKAECLANEFSKVPECTYGGDELGVIVVGDSHAAALIRAVERSLPGKQQYVLDWTMSNCPTIAKVKASDQLTYRCGDFVEHQAERSVDDPKLGQAPLIIINRTSLYVLGPNEPERGAEMALPYLYFDKPFTSRTPEYLGEIREGIIASACEFARNRPVYMVRPIPELKLDVPKTMGRALMQGKSIEVSISLDEYRARNAFVWDTQDLAAARCGVKILDPLPYLCRGGRCEGDVQGQPVYIDDDHLSERGGDLLVPMFRQVFNQLQPGDPSALPTRAHEEVAHLPPSDQSASPP
ncbi:acyltransferase family protein [Pseudomonas sp. GV071]|uniref:acyltransferase family protein n=1 Tax=Pseudomonas sp. GV071 TaxID=2135754 RepID=UPI000D4DB774|nr:acyltransferase family protein [Pseudomonas sp. GV071]PTQ70662.1 peptidoglycan/LPS O-acetylase OafA/YrhL [Pseudomonas sp. GV071]